MINLNRPKMYNRSVKVVALVLSVSTILVPVHGADDDNRSNIRLTPRSRTQGKLTLSYTLANKNEFKQELSFAEIVDTIAKRYKLSISYLGGGKPSVYYAFDTKPIIAAIDLECRLFDHPSSLVPDLAWFIEWMLPQVDVRTILSRFPYLVGPTGLVTVLASLTHAVPSRSFGKVLHRNMMSHLFVKRVEIPEKGIDLETRTYLMKNELATGYTLEAISHTMVKANVIDEFRLIIDLYDVELIGRSELEQDQLEADFSIPLAKGCSEHLSKIEFPFLTRTFSMLMKQETLQEDILILYDDSHAYLRKEFMGGSVSIWDIKRELMYHLDMKAGDKLNKASTKRQVPMNICSVSQIMSRSLSPSLRPFGAKQQSLNVLEFLGFEFSSYMGQTSCGVRACGIYEVVLKSAPVIFGTSASLSGYEHFHPENSLDFIVQLFVEEIERSELYVQPKMDENHFRPVRLKLFRRQITNDGKHVLSIRLLDSIEIIHFQWSLDGWSSLEGAHAFMLEDCFDEVDSRMNMKAAISLKRLKSQGSDPSKDQTLIQMNKFKLESDLINANLDHFDISHVQLTDYEIQIGKTLLPDGRVPVELSMSIADYHSQMKVFFWGDSYVVDDCENMPGCLRWHDLSEEECISLASLVDKVHMVAHCPLANPDEGDEGDGRAAYINSRCFAFFGESLAPIATKPEGSRTPKCQLHSFVRNRKAQSIEPDRFSAIVDFRFNFYAQKDGNQAAIFKATIEHSDIDHEVATLKLDGLKFARMQSDGEKHVSFNDTFEASNPADCGLLCDLDARCRSYSFCSGTYDRECTLSLLDLYEISSSYQTLILEASVEGHVMVGNRLGELNYKLIHDRECALYGRNYLSSFKQSQETLWVGPALVRQLPESHGALECAKRAIGELEQEVAMFGYCAATQTCILDKNLLSVSPSKQKETQNDTSSDEIVCNVYRRRYQTYFHVSSKIMPPQTDQQVELAASTVEECARVCWHQLGQVCASFDYCSPASCRVNQIANSSAGKLISEPGCLHYERDPKWDQVRRQRFIIPTETSFVGSFALFVQQMIITIVSLLVGLYAMVSLKKRYNLIPSSRQVYASRREDGNPQSSVASYSFGFESRSHNGNGIEMSAINGPLEDKEAELWRDL